MRSLTVAVVLFTSLVPVVWAQGMQHGLGQEKKLELTEGEQQKIAEHIENWRPQGETPEAKGQSIVDEAERRGEGYGDMSAELEMIIRNARGAEARRELEVRSLETEDGARSLTVVQAPKDVRGTALLTHTYDQKDDEQWVYFPAVKRVKRIAARGKSGPFMGSEFSYEDFSAQSSEKYNYRYLGEDTVTMESGESIDCYQVERIPKPEAESSYSRHMSWVEKKNLWLVRVEFYDQNDDHLKTLQAGNFELYKDRYWRPRELVMTNVRTRGVSILRWSNLQFGQGMSERDFDIDSLKAAR